MSNPAHAPLLALALSLAASACVQREAPHTSPSQDSKADKNMPVRALFKLDYAEDGQSGLTLIDSRTFVASLAEFAQAAPEVAALSQRDPRYTPQLAQALMHLTIGKDPVISREASVQEMRHEAGDATRLEQAYFDTRRSLSGPPASELNPPRWEGDKLVLNVCYDVAGGPEKQFVGTRYFFRFQSGTWSFTFESLPEAEVIASESQASITGLFGGKVLGFVRVSLDPSSALTSHGPQLFVALDPQKGASRYVLRDGSAKTHGFATFEAFERALPALLSTELRGRIAQDVYRALATQAAQHEQYKVIVSPNAYRENYVKQGRDTHKLSYWGDELRVTRFTVTDFNTLAAPAITDEVLVAYFEDSRGQPNKLRLDLRNLGWQSAAEMEPLFSSTIVSDTRLGTGGLEGPPLWPKSDPTQ